MLGLLKREVYLMFIIYDFRCNNCGNNTLDIRKGYWRANTSSSNIIKCSYEDNCIGGINDQLCLTGNAGVLCDSCDQLGIYWD
jgi:hypothetical protein